MLGKSRKIRRGLETVVIMGALALAFCIAAPRAAHAQNLQRFAANHLDFGGTAEVDATCSTLGTPGAVVKFYDNTVTMTGATDIVYITLSATGDTHSNNAAQFQCLVDGAPCFAGNVGSDKATGAGWVVLERNEADEHDNTVHYTWCVPIKKIKKNKHKVVLNLQDLCNGTIANDVFIEQVNVFVDGEHFGKAHADQACTTAGTGASF
jgi:hypothetical protein